MPANIRAGREFNRSVIDVADEEQCPARARGLPHEIEAIPVDGRTVWACIHCLVPWAELDERTNRHLRRGKK